MVDEVALGIYVDGFVTFGKLFFMTTSLSFFQSGTLAFVIGIIWDVKL